MYIIYAFVAILVLWTVWGAVSSQVENTPYTVLEQAKGYEVRLYPEHIVAQTTVEGSYSDALNTGFGIVAGYIFGGNTKQESIAMTAPVVEKTAGSEKIAMTAPVVASLEGESHTISFGMPSSYTLETLPTPTDSRVEIVTVPEMKMAVLRFSWLRTDARVQSKKEELLSALARDGVTVSGLVQYAGYNAPWTPPWMTRNEVMVEIN
ncbi:heme-binding protein [Patescibacteria group bacterium]|nr:heme-binding protein [Patescibacteria group bacterium]MBU1754876.1 heme-binding protein [Patescibacteria group bacterium]